jgi:hypothetical protein
MTVRSLLITYLLSSIFNQKALHQVWILIPHQPEKNRLLKEQRLICQWKGHRQINFVGDFDPKKGDRLATYKHGQYFMLEMPNSEDKIIPRLSFNQDGYLQIELSESILL